MKISIITACFNAQDTIEETIRSVANQTYDNIEYIIVDGASSDKTLEIIEKYKDKVTKLIVESDNGVYNAMNKGIKLATGDLLFFLNADDSLINELVVEKFVEQSQQSKAGLLLGNILMLNRYTGEMYYENHKIVDKIRLITSSVFHPATFFRKETFEKYGFYNESNKIAGDYEWYVNYFQNGGDYKYVDLPISIFSLGGLSSDEKFNVVHEQERTKIQEKYFSKQELNNTNLLRKFFPRKINKIKFRKLLEKLKLNEFYNFEQNIVKKWKVYIVSHNVVHDHMYKKDKLFNKNNYIIFDVSSDKMQISDKYSIVHQIELQNFQNLGKWWAESEAIYNIYHNKELYKNLDFIGFLHYDKELKIIETHKTDITKRINNYIKNTLTGHVCFEMHNTINDYNQKILADINQPNTLVGDGLNCYDFILKDYNDYFNINYSIQDFFDKKYINLCSCFLIDIKTFEKMMGFMEYIVKNKKLELLDTEHKYRIQGGLMERYFGLFLTFEYDNFLNLNLHHHYNKGLK
ncbi:MAG: glycosyltransferase family 2 protein [bacterium]